MPSNYRVCLKNLPSGVEMRSKEAFSRTDFTNEKASGCLPEESNQPRMVPARREPVARTDPR
jgi:hypothetical protein